MPDRDPVNRLQEAWSRIEIPTTTRALADEDSLTQESVAFLQRAWMEVEIPHVVLPKRGRLLKMTTYVTSVAAALLVSALVFLMQPKDSLEEIAPSSLVASSQKLPSSPKLIANNQEKVQVLAGKVRLTMLRDSGISPSTQTTDS